MILTWGSSGDHWHFNLVWIWSFSHQVLIHFHRKCSLLCHGMTGSQESLGVAMGNSLLSALFVLRLVRISLSAIVIAWKVVTVNIVHYYCSLKSRKWCQQHQGHVFDCQRMHELIKCVSWKLLCIKVSARCINVNVKYSSFLFQVLERFESGTENVFCRPPARLLTVWNSLSAGSKIF